MNKPLSEMSLEELWQLFPIQLVEHRTCWENWYRMEKNHLLHILPDQLKFITLAVRRSMAYGQNQLLIF